MARLTTMGELTASIAHEINQPLAAIVTQSEAALRFLDRDEPDLGEVQDALSSIRRDGMRASEVIRGLRALARKSGPQLSRLEIDDVIGQVLAISRGECCGTMLCCVPSWLRASGRSWAIAFNCSRCY
jgi:C4-dicarboxylate-specific signal transduction histidine kinase